MTSQRHASIPMRSNACWGLVGAGHAVDGLSDTSSASHRTRVVFLAQEVPPKFQWRWAVSENVGNTDSNQTQALTPGL